jgi:hypothetical protein
MQTHIRWNMRSRLTLVLLLIGYLAVAHGIRETPADLPGEPAQPSIPATARVPQDAKSFAAGPGGGSEVTPPESHAAR